LVALFEGVAMSKLKALYAAILFAVRHFSDLRELLTAGNSGDGDDRTDQPQSLLTDAATNVNLPCPQTTGLIADGVVTRVIDGDTIEVECRFSHRLRLIDCWAKEITRRMGTTEEEKQHGLAAKAFLENAILATTNNHVRVYIPGHDGRLNEASNMSRVLGRAWLRRPGEDRPAVNTDISDLMVRAGMATKTKGG
jgi:endonuclease YncB( thermonuclease family)